MSISHAIVFIPVILALCLSAALVSIAVMEGAYSQSGTYGSQGIMLPGFTGYAVGPDGQGMQEANPEPAENLSVSPPVQEDAEPAG